MTPANREIVKAIAPDYLHTAELHGDSYMTPELLEQIMQATRASMKPKIDAGLGLAAVLGVIMKMSDEAKELGGATSIAGVAKLHRMQTSIQNNGQRLANLAAAVLEKKP